MRLFLSSCICLYIIYSLSQTPLHVLTTILTSKIPIHPTASSITTTTSLFLACRPFTDAPPPADNNRFFHITVVYTTPLSPVGSPSSCSRLLVLHSHALASSFVVNRRPPRLQSSAQISKRRRRQFQRQHPSPSSHRTHHSLSSAAAITHKNTSYLVCTASLPHSSIPPRHCSSAQISNRQRRQLRDSTPLTATISTEAEA